MIQVAENLYVGNENDCFYDTRESWAVIHACKHPCHLRKVGYTGSLPPSHPEYLISESPGHLFLNMVDMQQQLQPKFAHPIMKRALEFINQNIVSKKILIHCNLGESRAPSIALVYLAKTGKIHNSSYQIAFNDFIRLYSVYIPGIGIRLYIQNFWQEIMNLT